MSAINTRASASQKAPVAAGSGNVQLHQLMVLYRETDKSPLSQPLGFLCEAEDCDHAEEQCRSAYPAAEVLWVSTETTLDAALQDYFELVVEFNALRIFCEGLD